MNKDIEKSIKTLNQGGIVIFPTDTAYGIGCRIDKTNSVRKLFKTRKRPESQPALVLVDSIEMAQNYLMPFDLKVRKLIEKYWPGALTIVYNCQIESTFPCKRWRKNSRSKDAGSSFNFEAN